MLTAKIKGTRVLKEHLRAFNDEFVRIITHQGGTRSSKTYSIAQGFILVLLQSDNEILTVSRKTGPALKKTVMRDFFEILQGMDLYNEANHNKTDQEYYLGSNLVEFVSLDQPQKKRGGKRTWLWLNEANEYSFEDYFQMMIRTSKKVVLDYNPSDDFHWIYDKVIPRKDSRFIKSTYKDNPFLEKSLIDEIERLEAEDEEYWKIYGLGEKGQSKELIYSNWDIVEEFPSYDQLDDVFYGLDFGFNNPSCLVRIGVKDDKDVYIDELIYQRNLTNQALIEVMKGVIPEEDQQTKMIKADTEPDRILEIENSGFIIEAAQKGKVKKRIDKAKRKRLHVTSRSVNGIQELKSYKWKVDKSGNVLEDPVKFRDHFCDAFGYGLESIDDPEPGIRLI